MNYKRINSMVMPLDFGLEPAQLSTSLIGSQTYPCSISIQTGAASMMLCTTPDAARELITKLQELLCAVEARGAA